MKRRLAEKMSVVSMFGLVGLMMATQVLPDWASHPISNYKERKAGPRLA